MFELMLFAAIGIAVLTIIAAFDGSRDVFHPLIFTGPMFAFLYGWMPWKLLQQDGLSRFFDGDQLRFVQSLNLLGVLAFTGACLAVGARVKRPANLSNILDLRTAGRLLIGGAIVGTLGLSCWLVSIINVGGFRQAFSTSYTGGWDPSGYVRDGSLLLLVGVLFPVTVLSAGGPRLLAILELLVFGVPWLTSARTDIRTFDRAVNGMVFQSHQTPSPVCGGHWRRLSGLACAFSRNEPQQPIPRIRF